MSTYPKADATTQWWDDDWGWDVIIPNVLVVHTTEGYGWPTYKSADGKDGAKAPNVTAFPNCKTKTVSFRQHFANEHSSRALVNLAGGVTTNTNNAWQIELIGTCDDRYKTSWGTKKAGVDYIHWPTAPDWALAALADLFAYLTKKFPSLPLESTVEWAAYNNGLTKNVRLTNAQWQAKVGILGHQHVPENTHGDPGLFPVQKVITMAKAILAGGTPVPETPKPTTCTMKANYPSVTRGTEVTITATVSPTAEGQFKFIWKNGDKWDQIGPLVPAVGGRASIKNTPYSTVRYGVLFYAKDPAKFENSQAPSIVVDVIDPGALQKQVLDLTARVTALEQKP